MSISMTLAGPLAGERRPIRPEKPESAPVLSRSPFRSSLWRRRPFPPQPEVSMTSFKSDRVAEIHRDLPDHLPSDSALRVKTLESLLVAKDLVDPRHITPWETGRATCRE